MDKQHFLNRLSDLNETLKTNLRHWASINTTVFSQEFESWMPLLISLIGEYFDETQLEQKKYWIKRLTHSDPEELLNASQSPRHSDSYLSISQRLNTIQKVINDLDAHIKNQE
jgi:hypothetical protein